MIYNFLFYFFLFFIYSVVGYLAEIIFCSICNKKLVVNRGFMLGPYLPIYGTGMMLLVFAVSKYKNDPLTLFITSTVYCTILEYITSYIMEKLFKLRWWDYSDKKFNINGRVCLSNGVLFGIGGLLIVEFINPAMVSLLSMFNKNILMIISTICLIGFLVDYSVSCQVIFNIKNKVKQIEKRDATEEIKEEVRKIILKNSYLTHRLLKAFPEMEKFNSEAFNRLKEELNKRREEIKKIKLELKNKRRSK